MHTRRPRRYKNSSVNCHPRRPTPIANRFLQSTKNPNLIRPFHMKTHKNRHPFAHKIIFSSITVDKREKKSRNLHISIAPNFCY